MSSPKQQRRFAVRQAESRDELTKIVDGSGAVIALVTADRAADAHMLAAAPEMYDRLTEVSHLRRADGKHPKPLLPSEAIAGIQAALRHARGDR